MTITLGYLKLLSIDTLDINCHLKYKMAQECMTITLGYLKLLSMDTLDINCHLKWQTGTRMHDHNNRVSKTAVYGYPRH